MKHRNEGRIIIIFSAITLLAAPSAAQDWGEKMFEHREFNFGNAARLADTTFKVKVSNPYLEEIRITNLSTSCGCIQWTAPVPTTIASRGEREFTIRVDTVRHSGDKHVKAFATLVEPIKGLTAKVTISVEGRIQSGVEVRPSSVGFGVVDCGRGSSQRVSVTHNGQANWKIISANVGNAHLATEIVEQRRSSGVVQYDVVVTLKPDAPAGVLRDRLTLTTNEDGNSDVSIPIEAKVEDDIVVTDAQFGTINHNTSKSVIIVLRAKKPFQIDKVEHVAHEVGVKPATVGLSPTSPSTTGSESHTSKVSDAFKIVFPTTVTPIHMLTLTFTPPSESGLFHERFSVTISGRPSPVIFQATGRVVDQSLANTAR